VLKRNALKNNRTLGKLNPYGLVLKRNALKRSGKVVKKTANTKKSAAKKPAGKPAAKPAKK
jgi:hypothetical protein